MASSDPNKVVPLRPNPPRPAPRGDAGPASAPIPLHPSRTPLSTFLLGLSLVLIAFNLRPAVTSLGPVLPEVMRGIGLTPAGASALTFLPTFCFGLFGPAAPVLARRFGTERALMIVLVVLAAGAALRAFASQPAMFVSQVLVGFSIGVGNVLLPGLVKRDFPKQMALMLGLFSMSLSVGAAVAAAVSVPLARAFGGSWVAALTFWAAPALLTALLWLPQLRPSATGPRRPAHRVRGLWRDPLAWQVSFFMGLQSGMTYIIFGWLATILRDRGLAPATAGYVVSACIVASSVSSLFAPALTTRGSRLQQASNVGCALLGMAGLLGCMYAPLSAVWLWSCVAGTGMGCLLALALSMIVLRAGDSHVAAELSSMAQGVGYVVASCGPLLAGLLHGWTGSWHMVAVLFSAMSLATAAAGFGAGRDRHVKGVVQAPE